MHIALPRRQNVFSIYLELQLVHPSWTENLISVRELYKFSLDLSLQGYVKYQRTYVVSHSVLCGRLVIQFDCHHLPGFSGGEEGECFDTVKIHRIINL